MALSQQSNSSVAAAPVPALDSQLCFHTVATIRLAPFFRPPPSSLSLPLQPASAPRIHSCINRCLVYRHNPSNSWRGTLTNHPPDSADKNMALSKQPRRHRSSSDPFSDPPTVSYSAYGVPTLSRTAPSQQYNRAPPVPPKIPSKSPNSRSYPKQTMATEITTVSRQQEHSPRTRVGRSQTHAPACVIYYLQLVARLIEVLDPVLPGPRRHLLVAHYPKTLCFVQLRL